MWDLIVSVPDHCLSFYFDEVNLCFTQIHYTNYDVHPPNNLEDMRQKSLDHEI